jgi:acyl-coenzyme A synthetase/AMP-(fatty) acid ligase
MAALSKLTRIVLSCFDLKTWCQAVQKFMITLSYVVPPIVLYLAKDPSVHSYDLPTIRVANRVQHP